MNIYNVIKVKEKGFFTLAIINKNHLPCDNCLASEWLHTIWAHTQNESGYKTVIIKKEQSSLQLFYKPSCVILFPLMPLFQCYIETSENAASTHLITGINIPF